jgi:hypothetical protein
MSVTHTVFLLNARLPTAEPLNPALRKEGVDLQLDPEWNTRESSGFWPATFQGQVAGFEWLIEPIADAELDARTRKKVAKYDTVVSLVTRSHPNQMASAVAGWGVLTAATEGLAYADESGDFFEPAEALEIARDQVAEPPEEERPVVARVVYPRDLDERLEVTEGRRTSHSLSLEHGEQRYVVFLETKSIPAAAAFAIHRRVEHRAGVFGVLELQVNQDVLRFTPSGAVLEPSYRPDYGSLVRRLGDTESVGLALRSGGSASVPAFAAFIKDDSVEVQRRRLAIITLGLMGEDATGALATLRSIRMPALAPDAATAVERIVASTPQ